MSHVVLLRGVNVGGHRTVRPKVLAAQLRHLGAISIGTAGTFVIPAPITPRQLRAEFARRLPFAVEIVSCQGHELLELASRQPFVGRRVRGDDVRFVSVLARRPHSAPSTPLWLPSRRGWLVRAFARFDRFVVGAHRRRMQAIGCLGSFDRIFGVPVTTRSWSTITKVASLLAGGER